MKKRTVLIVDDQQVNRKILARLLGDTYHLLEAYNGVLALSILRENSETISAVLLDIIMPVMDGYEVLKAMQADPVLSKIPVIVSSQRDGEESEVKALALGAQDFIAKPYKADIILHRLANTIRLRETAAMINKVEKDELTGLYNKQFFIEKSSERLQQNPEVHYDLMCFGIERFRLINETYGPVQGDELLRHIAKLLLTLPDSILYARFTADLFYLLLPHNEHYDPSHFSLWAQKVNAFPIDMDIKLHCGIYDIHNTGIPVSVMCDRAQMAAQANKGLYDRPFSLYDNSLRQKLLDEQFITGSMRAALQQHQFQVYYQPKYDLAKEQLAGAEALVRWIHPERGFLSPGMFIPLFERNGFITQLDQYVWETVCRDMRAWMDEGHTPVATSVNVSRADIYNPKLADILLGLVAKYQIPLRYLHLEITESAYTTNPEQIIVSVNKLRSLGFIIEMDDFGSGYSSLNMLAEMPVDVLKLDMGFIQHETGNRSGRGILSFVISLAKWLNLAVVAEGVETAEQISTLRSMDCNYVQGFYYAKPMTLEDFHALLLSSPPVEMICNSQTVRQYIHTEPDTSAKSDRVMLVVDDIELNRAVLASTFASSYALEEAENGAVAWDYLNRHYEKVDIVLLDLLMPVMDGFQLLSKIRADSRMERLPVIITSQGDVDSEQRALEMQADDFISKPYNPDIIRHRVRNVMDSHRLHLLTDAALHHLPAESDQSLTMQQRTLLMVDMLKPHFDIVRLVDPENTFVCDAVQKGEHCELNSCYSVWGKAARCKNCTSMKALQSHGRCSKLEYSNNGLYFVISEYVPNSGEGIVLEMVTKLKDDYVDNILDKDLLYINLDSINHQLDSDFLTGVFNRRHIDRHLAEYVAAARRDHTDMGIAMVDIDAFKKLNDSYGHQAGDTVIRDVAQILSRNVAQSRGDFVARYGGDEFVLVCRSISPEAFCRRVRAVAQLISHITLTDDTRLPIGISAGCISISEFPDLDAAALINRADKRLYLAKQAGRGRVIGATEESKL